MNATKSHKRLMNWDEIIAAKRIRKYQVLAMMRQLNSYYKNTVLTNLHYQQSCPTSQFRNFDIQLPATKCGWYVNTSDEGDIAYLGNTLRSAALQLAATLEDYD
jgi:hypothetical protein